MKSIINWIPGAPNTCDDYIVLWDTLDGNPRISLLRYESDNNWYMNEQYKSSIKAHCKIRDVETINDATEDDDILEDDCEYIAVDDIEPGDYIYIDGVASFCEGSDVMIATIEKRYDELTGQPYKLITDENGYKWRSDNEKCVGGLSAYSIYCYKRKK